ncbi:MAG: protein translocase subunit SecDF [Crocinitomicaceae bacterium]
MRNKGFFWFLTILLTVICIYQLSFTYFSNSVEVKADKASVQKVDDIFAAMEKSGDSVLYLPNNTSVNISDPEARELAKAAFVNDTLKQLATTSVYPIFGSTFKDVKKRSLAFGLDLVGGMSVTLEISVPELLKSYARNPRSSEFKNVYDKALDVYRKQGGDFITLFAEQQKALNPEGKLVRLFAISDIEELDMNSTDDAVVGFLKSKETGAMEGVEEIMNRRINQFGVAQPNIQKDPAKNRLYIELPGVQDESTVAEKLQSTANLQFFETYNYQVLGPVIQEADRISRTEQSDETEEEVAPADTTAAAPADSTALAADSTESLDLSLDNTSADGSKGLGDYLLPYGGPALGAVLPENKTAVDAIINRKDVLAVFPQDLKLMWSEDMEIINTETNESGYVLYMIRVPEDGKARVGGKDIEQASTERNQQEAKWTVSLKMTDEGADKWGRMTEDNKGLYVAITMDDVVYSAPRVNEAITSGNTEISGSFTLEDANNLTSLLNGGALPAPCVIKEQTKVGPTIGAENSRAGLISFGIALLMVFIYMVFYYGKAGIVADIALFANILFIFGSLSSFGAVLTLAGIAGIVLTIGMAVDANVLIFERVREEQTAGKDLKSAIDTGFQKALSSIIDANVTTLLTAIVLKVFGSGPIESFATTLIIGIFTSVFAALVITRLVINWWLEKGKSINFESKMTKGAFKNFNIDFVGKRKTFYLISGVLIVGGLVALLTKGLNPSVEFSGGRTFGVKFENPVADQTDYIGKELGKVFKEDGKEASSLLKTKSNSYFLEITTNYKLGDESANQLVKEKLIEGLNNTKKVTGGFTIEESRSVSPTVSKELISSSTIAIILSLIIIFTYILLRFGKWQYSTGAILAMLHDVTLVLAVFSIFNGILPFNMDIDQAFIAAILTVIGYSINDTVIVFDRIRENLGLYKGEDENNNINKSLNSTLSRTINTSMTTFIVLLIIFLFGGAAIKGFIFALMIGVIVGTYSSVCIATPVLIDFSKSVRKVKS